MLFLLITLFTGSLLGFSLSQIYCNFCNLQKLRTTLSALHVEKSSLYENLNLKI